MRCVSCPALTPGADMSSHTHAHTHSIRRLLSPSMKAWRRRRRRRLQAVIKSSDLLPQQCNSGYYGLTLPGVASPRRQSTGGWEEELSGLWWPSLRHVDVAGTTNTQLQEVRQLGLPVHRPSLAQVPPPSAGSRREGDGGTLSEKKREEKITCRYNVGFSFRPPTQLPWQPLGGAVP